MAGIRWNDIPRAEEYPGTLRECLEAFLEFADEDVEKVYEEARKAGVQPLQYIVTVLRLVDYDDLARFWGEHYGIRYLKGSPKIERREQWYFVLEDGSIGIPFPSDYLPALEIVDGDEEKVVLIPYNYFEVKDIKEEGIRGRFYDLIQYAQKLGTTDISFEVKQFGIEIRFRLLGDMIRVETLSFEDGLMLQQTIKTIASRTTASLNTEEWMERQGARIEIPERKLDLRLEFAPSLTHRFQNYTIRLLSKEMSQVKGVEDIQKLGYYSDDVSKITETLHFRDGLNIMSGATGSGKSRTFNVLLSLIPRTKKILSVEDPVEYRLDNAIQHQIFQIIREKAEESINMDYLEYIRAFMRQDPDIIFIGEWRKINELTEALLYASETGHLVFTTLHSSRVVNVPNLLINQYGLLPDDIANNMNIIVNQRLLKRVCPYCSSTKTITEEDIHPFTKIRFRDKQKFETLIGKEAKVPGKEGCSHCQIKHPATGEVLVGGYAGRTLLYEYLLFDDEVREKIMKTTSSLKIEDLLIRKSEEGLGRTFVDVAVRKIANGEIDITETLGGLK